MSPLFTSDLERRIGGRHELVILWPVLRAEPIVEADLWKDEYVADNDRDIGRCYESHCKEDL